MIQILFFARLREQLGQSKVQLSSDALETPTSIQTVLDYLQHQNPSWRDALSSPDLCFAIDQEQAQVTDLISQNCEVAIFPPVTGG
ncbi:MoaD/ThiS family protein [Alginatibacterium sediminis]|uniref:MoaD/ThiS family protein n=1 Tax=Alginatibacterium sediminis TaxID=2164068 RepID=A0A420EHJ8_9ALTE|nr:MoaD/ThiS family protein [Alginatibacterium sediminis]RKF20153.1 MoaD/ThiS family protein [Alginatibacterium sediminis]